MKWLARRPTRALSLLATAAVLVGATFVTTAQARHVSHTAAAKPAYGGSYSYYLSTPPDCLDPQKTAADSSNIVDGYVFDTLVAVNPKGHYTGDLATKWKASDHGKRVTFFLRKGVRFSNGDPFTANDVKFTFDRALRASTKSPVTASDLDGVKQVKVLNKYAVQLVLSAPNRPLITNLASAYTGILDKKSIGAQGSNTCNKPVGTGPYKIVSTGTAFGDVVVTANKYHKFAPHWIHNKGVPYITRVEFKTITSPSTAISELLSGGIDMALVPGTQIDRVKGNKNVALHTQPSQAFYFMEFNTAHPPFNKLAVRRAVVQTINRQNIVKAAFSGQAKPDLSPLAPAIPFYDKAAGKLMPKYNIAAAAKTIRQYRATGPYSLMDRTVEPYSTMGEIVQQSAGQAGMRLTIDSKATLADFVPAARSGSFDILLLGIAWPDPDVLYLLLDSSQISSSGLNFTSEKHQPALDKLLRQGRKTLSRKKAAQIYAKAQEYINKQLDFVPLVAPTSILAVRSNIKGYHTDSGGGIAIQDLYIKTK